MISDINFFSDVDDFLNLSLDDQTNILLHGITSSEASFDNFIVHDPIENFVIGTINSDTLNGTSGNDFIDGYAEECSR